MKYSGKVILIILFLFGFFLRTFNSNWDQGYHLHPDERFLAMVGDAMEIPQSFSDYINPKISLLNPANIKFPFFVYGIFPLTLNKILAVFFGNDSYGAFTLQGRLLSALFDAFLILVIFKTVQLFEKRFDLHHHIKYYASFFYAIAVLPIQLSHFFAVDPFLTCFLFLSFYFACRYSFLGKVTNISSSAFFFGLAVASKISAVYMLPLLMLLLLLRLIGHAKQKKIFVLMFAFILFPLITYSVIRFADPYLFADQNFFNPMVSSHFIENLKSLKSWEGSDTTFPPAIQWIPTTPILFSLKNLAFFGVGLPYFFFLIMGFLFAFRKRRDIALLSILFWILAFFLYQSTQFVKAMRYFYMLYPFFAILTAIGFYYTTRKLHPSIRSVILFIIFLWPLSYMSIYVHTSTRIQASQWIYENLSDSKILATEHWDDPLPLLLPQTNGKQFRGEQLPVFDPESPEKWQKIDEILNKVDYYVLSSNRTWGSLPKVSGRYPVTTTFYNELFAEKRGFEKIADFTSYPSLTYLGIPFTFPDDWADESFTVYDHPRVMIFQKR